ncbi:MAG: MBL fold metallo-hydrolase [Lachnospiraceae bacterium]|nr:MBL fold metallo-hydrolase [Lachnospiraceae bacterium]
MLSGYEAVYAKLTEYLGTGANVLLYVAALLFFGLYQARSESSRGRYLRYVLLLMLAALNPVTVKVLEKLGHLDVLERFFWLLMTPVLIAAAAAIISEKKPFLLIVQIILILLCGKIVFTGIEYKPAQNIYKIQSDAIAVSDIILRDFEGLDADAPIIPNRGLEDEKRPRAVITEPLCEDVRMYNADVDLWYVRNGFGSAVGSRYRRIAELVSQSNDRISVKKLARKMKKFGFTYLVLGDWQQLVGNTRRYHFEQIGESGSYKVYKYVPATLFTLRHYPDPEGYNCMSYTLAGDDGSLIVVDGGRAWQSLELVDTIKKLGGRVDAWIITHPHDDHAGVLASILEAEWDKSEIEIGQIYLGEWDFDAVDRQGIRTDSVHYLLGNLEKRDNVTYLSQGQELSVCGLTMKVLHTCNPEVVAGSDNILNDGSMVFKLSGEKTSILFLGDVADNSAALREKEGITDEKVGQGSKMGRLIAEQILSDYPEDVKSTFVQMAHHGNSQLPDAFYEAVSPKAAIFDAPDWLMENRDKETGESSYYTTPHYRALMEKLGAKIITFSENKPVKIY